MAQTLKSQLEKVLQDEILRGGFSGSASLKEFSERPSFSGGIDLAKLRQIHIKFNPAYEDDHPGETKRVIADIGKHEVNHREYKGYNGCPRTLDNHVKLIFEPIANVLKPKKYNNKDCHYISNALEDTILHTDLNSGFKLDGITDFLEEVGKYCENEVYTPFYEAHVKLNMYLWGTKKQKAQVAKYFVHNKDEQKKIKDVLTKFLSRTGIKGLTESEETLAVDKDNKLKTVNTTYKSRDQIRDYLNDSNNWKKISTIYAEEFSKLMTPSYSMPLFDHDGEGTSGNEPKDPEEGEDGGADDSEPGTPENTPSPDQGHEFDQEMETEDYKRERVFEAHENGEKLPSWINRYTALDLIYQHFARRLNLKVETFTQDEAMPVFHYGERKFDPEKDNFKRVFFGINEENGKVELKKKRFYETMKLPVKNNPKGFPEARFGLIDVSGSMAESIDERGIGQTNIVPWGDNSKYHYSLLSWYGFIEYLKQNHLLNRANVSLATFSEKTKIKYGLDEAKKMALNPVFGNDTRIAPSALDDFFKGEGNLVFTISDGAISNYREIREKFIEGAKKHYFFYLQIGPHNEYTRDLQKNGVYVETIERASDLATKVIDLTDKLYRGKCQ